MQNDIVLRFPKERDCFPYIPGFIVVSPVAELDTDKEKACLYKKEDEYTSMFKNAEGQITLESKFGKELFMLMTKKNAPTKWVEIGAWNGNGTTTCILEALQLRANKEGVVVASYEASPFFYKLAKENLERYSNLKDHFQLIHGKIADSTGCLEPEKINDKSNHYILHYEEEKYIYSTSPVVPLWFEPEVAILDGGEYSGRNDWMGLPKRNLQYIFLDDVFVEKNREVNALLEKDPEWECVHKGMDRNGWCYYRKKETGI